MLENTPPSNEERNNCPCGSSLTLPQCCLPFIRLELFPETPEQLMRSRYTAYVLKDIDYIIESTFPNERKFYPKKQLISWANEVTWKGLSIVETVDNQVKFIAYFTAATNQLEEHREWSFFEQENGRWYFKEGREF